MPRGRPASYMYKPTHGQPVDSMPNTLDPDQFERLVRRHAAALALFASQWTNAAEDCVQEAFWELYRQAELPERIVPWLYRVVRNRAISMVRSTDRRRRHERQAAEQADEWFIAPQPAEFSASELGEALAGLDEECREVLVARIWGGLSLAEAAEALGCSASSVHRRYAKGLKQLRERLGLKWLTKNDSTTT